MDILHGHLEPIEAPGLWDLNLGHESLSEVLDNNTVGGSKEGEHVLDEVLLTFVKFVPIFQILTQVDFLGCPEASHLVLVHLPDVVVVDWKDHESVGVLVKDWLWKSLGEALGLVLGMGLLGWTNSLSDATVLTMVVVNEL